MAPCLLLLDNIEIVLGGDQRGEGESPSGRGHRASHPALDRLLSALLVEIDGLSGPAAQAQAQAHVVVLATTSSVQGLDKALTRPGRLEEHVGLGLPGPAQRLGLLRHLVGQIDAAVLAGPAGPAGDESRQCRVGADEEEEERGRLLEAAARAMEGRSQAAIINAVQAASFRALAGHMRDRAKVSLATLLADVA